MSAAVVVDVPEDLPLAQVDPGLLERAFANVIGNAIHWSPPGRSVEMQAVMTVPDLEVRVIDHGPGSDATPAIGSFCPSNVSMIDATRARRPRTRHRRGFVNAMNGELIIEDTPGGGATFRCSSQLAVP